MAERSTRLLFAVAVSPFLILGVLFLSIQLSLFDEKMSALVSTAAFLAGALLFFTSKALTALRLRATDRQPATHTPILLVCFRTGYTLMSLAVLNSVGLFTASQIM